MNKLILKKCPNCGSFSIKGGVSIERGFYVQKIFCKKCGYKNNRIVGNASRE